MKKNTIWQKMMKRNGTKIDFILSCMKGIKSARFIFICP